MLANQPPEDASQIQFALRMVPLWQEVRGIRAHVVKLVTGQVFDARQLGKEALDARMQRIGPQP